MLAMAGTPGEHQFVASVRVGSNALGIDTAGKPVRIALAGAAPVEVQVRVFAPGDVATLDRSVVVRQVPSPGSTDFEPNLFPSVELAHPALPWMFDRAARMPWLILVVVEARPGVSFQTGASGRRVLVIDQPSQIATELPDLAEAWAWVHAYGSGATGAAVDAAAYARSSESTTARLLCPRRLEPRQHYHAVLVPATIAGVRAGLGEEPPADPDAPAWTPATPMPLRLPAYLDWTFATGDGGDFASLARQLRARPIEGRAVRTVDAAAPGWGVPAADGRDAVVGGMLRTDEGAIVQPTDAAALGDAIVELIDHAAGATAQPLLAPPCYGAFATGADRTADQPPWQRAINHDVRLRTAAGLGAAVVKRAQDDLVAAAWQQLGDAEEANRLIHAAELSAAISVRLLARLDTIAGDGELIQVMRPAHRRVRMAPPAAGPAPTLTRVIADSVIPTAVMGAGFRRLAHTRGRLAGARVSAGALAERTNRGAGAVDRIDVVPPRSPPSGAAVFDAVSIADGVTVRFATARPAVVEAAAAHWRAVTPPVIRPPVVTPPVITPPVITRGPRGLPDHDTDPPVIGMLARRVDPGDVPWMPEPPSRGPRSPVVFDALALAARRHQRYLLEHLSAVPRRPIRPLITGGSLATVRARLVAAANPIVNLARGLDARISGMTIDGRFRPVAVTPVLERPLIHDLKQLGLDHVMPGLSTVAQDAVALLVPDNAAITGFLLGANHELAAELMWRRYPGPTHDTLLRTFWGRMITGVAGPIRLPDIPVVREWAPSGPPPIPVSLVLLVRGAVLERYPGAVVYLVEAQWSGQFRVVGTAERAPIVRVPLSPDTSLFGFDLDPDVVAGGSVPGGPAGWYVVIAEHPHEPRFGLAATSTPFDTWNDLAWSQVEPTDLHGGTHLVIGGPLATRQPADPAALRWGRDAAQQAAIVLRRPVRVAFHGSRLITPDPT
jgi:hypothetical protein